jgi:hypothetical protein
MIAFLEDVLGRRVCDYVGISADGDDGCAGKFANAQSCERFPVGSVSHFDFEGIKADFSLNGNLFNRAAAEHFIAALAETEYLPVDGCGTIAETAEDSAK